MGKRKCTKVHKKKNLSVCLSVRLSERSCQCLSVSSRPGRDWRHVPSRPLHHTLTPVCTRTLQDLSQIPSGYHIPTHHDNVKTVPDIQKAQPYPNRHTTPKALKIHPLQGCILHPSMSALITSQCQKRVKN
jgi:hypothetical protein